MKRQLPVGVLLLMVIYFAVTGFQCGSAEMTTAKLAIKNQQYDKAEESLLRSVEKNPQDEEAWFMLGQVRLELKKYTEMNEAYTRALAISNTHQQEISTNCLVVWNRLYQAAIDDYDKAEGQPENYDSALKKLLVARDLNPDSVQTYFALGLVQYQKGDYPASSASLKAALEKDPNYTQALYLLSDIHLNGAVKFENENMTDAARKEYAAAADILEKAFKQEPEKSENIQNLILALERSGQEERALTLTSEAVSKNPDNPNFRYAYGVYLLKQEKFEASIEQFEKAVELDPANSNYTYNCGAAYLNWGVAMKQEADKKLEQSGSKTAQIDLAYKEKFKVALPFLEKSTELKPDDAEFWQSLAKAYTYLGMVEESEKAFEQFDRLSGGN